MFTMVGMKTVCMVTSDADRSVAEATVEFPDVRSAIVREL
jgi:hypothetical protein